MNVYNLHVFICIHYLCCLLTDACCGTNNKKQTTTATTTNLYVIVMLIHDSSTEINKATVHVLLLWSWIFKTEKYSVIVLTLLLLQSVLHNNTIEYKLTKRKYKYEMCNILPPTQKLNLMLNSCTYIYMFDWVSIFLCYLCLQHIFDFSLSKYLMLLRITIHCT